MLDFNFQSPTKFYFGKEKENKVGDYLKQAGATRVFLHYGGQSAEKSGLLDRVRASLKKSGLFFTELGGVKPNPRDDLVYQGIEICRRENIDFILAVGGGSVIDSAKAISFGVFYEGDFWEIFATRKPINQVLPLGTILTIPAAGSEGSNSVVITKIEGDLKRGYGSNLIRPVFSVMNPELAMTLPDYHRAAGITDMMAHILERYLSNTERVELTDRMCEGVLKAIMHEALILLENPKDYDAWANIMWSGTIAHSDILGLGREQDWASHQIEHELSALYDCIHGAGLAVVLPNFMRYTLKHDVARYTKLATRVFECEMDFENPEKTANEGINRFSAFLKKIGMPLTFTEIGAKAKDIPYLSQKVRRNNGEKVGFFMPLDNADVENIFRMCL